MSVQKTYSVDSLTVQIFPTRQEMGESAAMAASAYLISLLEQKKEVNLLFAAAPSQNEFLSCLSRNKRIDWSRINAFHMDEYIGLPSDHPAGFYNFLKRSIFDALPLRTVNQLNGNAADPEAEARRYGELLAAHPLDIAFIGVGENGHIAFNDPSVANFYDPKTVKIVRLEEKCRMQQVHDGCFARLEDVPSHALTVTVPGIFNASRILCVVPAQTKAKAVLSMLTDPVDERCPASILRRHPAAALYCDLSSASLLPVLAD